MAVTAIMDPMMSDAEFLSQFDKNTRFCMITDQYNTSPFPPKTTKKITNVPLVEQLMQQEKNIIFLTTVWHEELNNLDNVHYYNPHFLYINHLLKTNEIDISKTKDVSIANAIGIADRCNRILASHWLAKNFPINELLLNWNHNDSLVPIKALIEDSSYYHPKHIRKNKFLRANFFEMESEYYNLPTPSHGDFYRFINHNLPNLFCKSMLTILTDTGNQEISNSLSEKTLFAMASGCLVLPVGVFQCNHVLQRMGFCTFENVLDMTHLNNKDMYAMTVMGFENNKSIITSKDQIQHLWNQNKKEIQHNHNLCCKSDKIKNFFAESIKLAKHACSYLQSTNKQPGRILAYGIV